MNSCQVLKHSAFFRIRADIAEGMRSSRTSKNAGQSCDNDQKAAVAVGPVVAVSNMFL